MVDKDTLHTVLYADNNIYHYIVMPFGLINVGLTYQRMVNKLFTDIMEDTMEAYVNDMLMKFKVGVNHQKKFECAFARMRLHNDRPKPSKRVFGIKS